jgi:hypothetical protein
MWRYITVVSLTIVMTVGAWPGEARQFSDVRAVVDFQRAADAYAFLHRRVERSLPAATPDALAAAIRAARPPGTQHLFTPTAANAFRNAVTRAMRAGCDVGDLAGPPAGAVEYGSATSTRAVTPCLSAVLPALPAELEYRSAGGALVIVDTQAAMVIDVLTEPLAGTEGRR